MKHFSSGLCVVASLLIGLAGCSYQPQMPARARQSDRAPVGMAQHARMHTTLRDVALLEQFATTGRMRTGAPANFAWLPNGSGVLYTRARSLEERTQDLYLFDTSLGEERRLLTSDDVLGDKAETLTPEEAARRERLRLNARGIARCTLSPDGRTMLIPLSGSQFLVDVASARDGSVSVRELISDKGSAIDAKFSPDAARIALRRGGEVFVREIATGVETQLTRGAGGHISHGEAEFVAQEEMDRTDGFWWSADSTSIIYQRNDDSMVEAFRIADAGNPGREPREYPYPRAGRRNVDVSLHIARVSDPDSHVAVAWDRARYPYLARVAWGEPALTILVQDRLQNEQVLLRVDPTTGATTPLRVERDEAWLNLHAAHPKWDASSGLLRYPVEHERGFGLVLLDGQGSERATVRSEHLPTGGVRAITGATKGLTRIWITAGERPSVTRTLVLDRAGESFVVCDAGEGTLTPSPDGRFAVRHSTSPTSATHRWEVVRLGADGVPESSPMGAIPSVQATPLIEPRVEFRTLRSRTSGREYEIAIVRPTDFDERRTYPVLNFVYAGPHFTIVARDRRRWTLEQWYAQQGFVVVSIDGRGTPNKGREWERAIKGNLIEVTMGDQVDAMQELFAQSPWMDPSRVGVYGWSFGGYFSLMAPTLRPDVFSAAAAGAPVADWRDYDTHYTERYMGLPGPLPKGDPGETLISGENTVGYDGANTLTHAPKLGSPLLILHGTADDNVYTTHSLRMADALTRAGKRYEFVPLLGQAHGVGDRVLTQRVHETIARFFIEHLKPE